ncbi:hypothetical protein CHLRE_03g213425v5 [Chlamydomonas reinhardtii]|uniref:Uncharacterized protein n=1 Tax=Chlamydomonas reinhardtii TaxID=3055 RepID=A8JBX5_CHLRE|nr:uncharacterized protein CHLRE_03g213425v5 [Chlamydomonas reinhardtii]PNW86093.1 hypothetical protein CHLRE_03g213425v5 [Chlamydomonas reinhardtii]|eukprot:XP_001699418.1 cytochrome c oxidase assembly protein [Chlamydomonas reinhardtii]
MATADITFTVGLLEKLAGMKKREPPAAKPLLPRSPVIPLPTRTPFSPDAARMVAQDAQLTRQLQSTREVAGLLVKHEEAEVAKMTSLAADLLKEFSVNTKPLPCQSESAACVQCFKANTAEAWKCSEVADAYRQCATAAFTHSRAAAAAPATAASG